MMFEESLQFFFLCGLGPKGGEIFGGFGVFLKITILAKNLGGEGGNLRGGTVLKIKCNPNLYGTRWMVFNVIKNQETPRLAKESPLKLSNSKFL